MPAVIEVMNDTKVPLLAVVKGYEKAKQTLEAICSYCNANCSHKRIRLINAVNWSSIVILDPCHDLPCGALRVRNTDFTRNLISFKGNIQERETFTAHKIRNVTGYLYTWCEGLKTNAFLFNKGKVNTWNVWTINFQSANPRQRFKP